METVVIKLLLQEDEKRLTLGDLLNQAGSSLRSRCPGIIGKEEEEIGYIDFLGYEFTEKVLQLRYAYQKGFRRFEGE